jgi:hypothetical protein
MSPIYGTFHLSNRYLIAAPNKHLSSLLQPPSTFSINTRGIEGPRVAYACDQLRLGRVWHPNSPCGTERLFPIPSIHQGITGEEGYLCEKMPCGNWCLPSQRARRCHPWPWGFHQGCALCAGPAAARATREEGGAAQEEGERRGGWEEGGVMVGRRGSARKTHIQSQREIPCSSFV